MTGATDQLRRSATHRAATGPEEWAFLGMLDGVPEWMHRGQYADCLLCTPRTAGRSLPTSATAYTYGPVGHPDE